MPPRSVLATSHDGHWTMLRRGSAVTVFDTGPAPPSGGPPSPAGTATLESDQDDLVLVGPPAVATRISHAHGADGTRVELLALPSLAPTARLDLPIALTVAAIAGPRLVLLGPDRTSAVVVRTLGTALRAQPLETNKQPVELAVGMANNLVLIGLPRGLQVYDVAVPRAIARSPLVFPPTPRLLGNAHGHLWAALAGSDEVIVYRLSDARAFKLVIGAPVEAVVSHPASNVIVVVTPGGLVRVHCLAKSATPIPSPWVRGNDVAILPTGSPEHVSVIGVAPDGMTPWRVPISKPA